MFPGSKKSLNALSAMVRRACACQRQDRLVADLRDRACVIIGRLACWVERTLFLRITA